MKWLLWCVEHWQILLQALIAASFALAASMEQRVYLACGLTCIAAANGMMAVRRVTARIETIEYLNIDRYVLPAIITGMMFAGAMLVLLNRFSRDRYRRRTGSRA